MPDQPQTSSSDRKLAAIMFTDIVGYTALMQRDEREALSTIDLSRMAMAAFRGH